MTIAYPTGCATYHNYVSYKKNQKMKAFYIILIVSLVSSQLEAQYEFKKELTWKYAYEMIHQANIGNCAVAFDMFDVLVTDENFKHIPSYLSIAKCYQKEGKIERADSLVAIIKKSGDIKRIRDGDSVSHPKLMKRFILMLCLIHMSEPTRPERISYAVFC